MVAKIRCTTLFDITATGVRHHRRGDADSHVQARNQQRNWETINQIMGLRTLPENVTSPSCQAARWVFEFDVPDPASLATADDALGLLQQDSLGVPMITGLTETLDPGPCLQPGQNLWFEIVAP